MVCIAATQQSWTGFSLSEKGISLIIFVLSTAAFAVVVRPLFSDGYLMNFDHPMQQGVISCLQNNPSFFLSAAWCSHLQAGLAPAQSYPVLSYQIVLLFATIFGMAMAYKLFLLVIWLLLPAIVAGMLYRHGHYLVAAYAYAFILLDQGLLDITGPMFFLIHGSGFNQTLGFAFFFPAFYLSVRFFQNPSKRLLGWLSIAAAFSFLSHPSIFFFFAPVSLILLVWYFSSLKKHLLLVIAYPFLVFLVTSYVSIPLLFNLQSAEIESLPVAGASPWMQAYQVVAADSNPFFLVLGMVGLLLFWQGKELRLIPLLAGGVAVLWLAYPLREVTNLSDFSSFSRSIGVLHVLLLTGAGGTLAFGIKRAGVFSGKASLGMKLLAGSFALIFLLLSTSQLVRTSRQMDNIVTSSDPLFSSPLLLLEGLNATKGRVLLQETYGETPYPLNQSSLWGIGPLVTSSDLVHPLLRFFNHPYAGTKGLKIHRWRVDELDREDLRAILEGWNIEFIVAGSPTFKKAFSFLPVEKVLGPMTVFRNNATDVSFFKVGEGGVMHSFSYAKTRAMANVTAIGQVPVLFKVRYWGNWRAYVDGARTPVQRTPIDYMEVLVPAGDHVVEFRFGPRWWDWGGFGLTVVGWAVIAYLLVCSPLLSSPKGPEHTGT